MRSWGGKKIAAQKKYAGFEGKWLDIGIGECQDCGTERRLYRPVSRFDVHICAPCTQGGRLAAMPDGNDQQVRENNEEEAA